MNYYPHHIGDFRSGTVNMTRQSRWIYRDMMDVYYDTEKPLPDDLDLLCDMIGVETDEERRIVERLLRFKFIKTEDGYRHERCDEEIAAYHQKAAQARTNGKGGGRPRKQSGTNQKPSGNPAGFDPGPSGNPEETGSKANQEPITKNTSVPYGTGAGAPSPVDLIFANGVPLLVTAGLSDKQARTMLGMFRKNHGDDAVVAAIQQCVDEQALEPVGYLQRVLRTTPKSAYPPRPQSRTQANAKWMENLWSDSQPAMVDLGTFDASTGRPV